ncbi:gastrula zinc finger protein XlCGF26.1-like [Branchiostoma lanceolatum]|uniref:gastrula zinc finger protein XlCGF26.1-like n=1 Tax=Branchiostoma lanceolatum TaxID=7740 RepID=UPI0034565548
MAAANSGPSAKMSPLCCPLCDFASACQGALESHMSSHVRSKPEQFTCRICGYHTVSRSSMEDHVEMHKTRKTNRKAASSKPRCLLCEFAAADRLELEFHMFTHTETLGDLLLCRDDNGLTDIILSDGKAEELVSVQGSGRTAQNAHAGYAHAEKLADGLLCRDGDGFVDLTGSDSNTKGLAAVRASKRVVRRGRKTAQRSREKPLWCGECGYTARTRKELSSHLKTHYKRASRRLPKDGESTKSKKTAQNAQTVEKTLLCGECGYKAKYENELRNHLKIHYNEAFVCEKCGFKAWDDLAIKAHTGERPLECKKCSYTVSCKVAMRKHRQTHTNTKTPPLVCRKCGYQTTRKDNLVSHFRLHTGEKPFSCGQCDYKTAFKNSLTLHLKTNRCEKPLACQDCDYSTTCKRGMRMHLKNHTYTCKTCDAVLNSKEEFEKHMRNHRKEESEKALTCEVCGYKAISRPCLEVHLRKHTGEKPFACSECSYRAKAKATLRIHIANKHKKTFRCLECGYGTDEEKSMDDHAKQHVKRFTCGDCDFVATTMEDIDAHMADTHAGGAAAIMCGKCRRYWTTCAGKIGEHMQTCCADKL